MLKTALIGAGRIGQVHAANIAANPLSTLSAVVDINPIFAQSLADKYNSQVLSIEQVMQDPSINAVLIASATDTHADLIEQASRAGKAVMCEKPIDLDVARARDCLAIANSCGTPVLIGFNRRFDPDFSALQQRFKQGAIGAAEHLHITSRDPTPPGLDYIKVSGGLFRDMSIHDLDMARFILGEDPIAISASGSCVVDSAIGECGDIDTALITLEFPSGAIASIGNSRRTTYGYDQRIELHGAKGMLQANNKRENNIIQTNDEGVCSAKAEYFFLERYAPAYAAEWQHFIDIVLNNADNKASAADGVKALEMAELAERAMRTGQRQLFTQDQQGAA